MRKVAPITLAPIALVGLTMLIAPFAGATGKAAIPPYSVVFSHGSKQLKVLTLSSGAKLDVVWKDGLCYAGYASPPVAVTFSGPTTTGGVTDPTTAPNLAPCGRSGFPDDLYCWSTVVSPGIPAVPTCFWTYKRAASGSTARALPNPQSSENANLFLYKRAVLFAYVMKAGATKWKKMAVPPGTNAVHWYGPDGG
jgi:hypothetical protein